MELLITGKRYQGKFEIEAHSTSGTHEVDTEVGRHSEGWRRDWFEGKGMITDIETGLRERFLFSPKGKAEEHIIILGEGVNKTAIRDYKGVVDLALYTMYTDAKDPNRPIPDVEIPVLSLEMLARERLLHPDYNI